MLQDLKDKNRKDDRILVLRPKEGKKPVSSTGLLDPRLFTGENRLHIRLKPETCLWQFSYDSGILPSVFHQYFTSFQSAYNFAKSYFNHRNIEIVEVLD